MTVEQANAEVERYRKAVADLEARAEELRRQAEEAKALRAQAVLEQALEGGSHKAISEAAKMAAAVAVELESNTVALEEARRRLAEAEQKVAQAEATEARKEYERLAEERAALSRQIDEELEKVRGLMARYVELDTLQYNAGRKAGISHHLNAKALLTDAVAWHLRVQAGGWNGLIDIEYPNRRGPLSAHDPAARASQKGSE